MEATSTSQLLLAVHSLSSHVARGGELFSVLTADSIEPGDKWKEQRDCLSGSCMFALFQDTRHTQWKHIHISRLACSFFLLD